MPKYRNSLNVDPNSNDPAISRRSFLALMGLGVCVLGVASLTNVSLLGFLYPNAMKIPPSVFSLGRPSEVLSHDGKVFFPHKKFLLKPYQEKCASKLLYALI